LGEPRCSPLMIKAQEIDRTEFPVGHRVAHQVVGGGGDRFGKTLEPIDHRDQDVLDPRLRNSLITRSQNFAPSVCSIQMPRISLCPEQRMPMDRYTARLLPIPSLRIFTRIASKNTMA
jgi:hypothetical protein